MAELKVRDKYNTGWHSLGGIGSAGPQGVQGWQGFQGARGPQGVGGSQGPKGNQGYQGGTGYQGNQGVDGNQGWQGTQGGSGNQGYQGVQGAVGIDGIVWKGVWDSGDTYDPGDAVTHDGTSYVCILESLNHEPPNGTYWQILAVQGTQGNVGPQGPPGYQGNQGEDGVQGVPGNQGPTGLAGQQGVDGQQGATGILGDALAHSVVIDAGGSFKIGSGIKDDSLNGIFMDDTELVLQKDGENVLVMSADGTFDFIVGSGDNLTVSSGGGILIEAGGDITLESHATDPGKVIFKGTSYTTEFGPYSTDGSTVDLTPDTDNVVDLIFGTGATLLKHFYVNTKTGFDIQTFFSVLHASHVLSFGSVDYASTHLRSHYSAAEWYELVSDSVAQNYSVGNFYPFTNSAYTLGTSSKYWSTIYGDKFQVDGGFYLVKPENNPYIMFDTGDFIFYDRFDNKFYFYAGATIAITISNTQLWLPGNISALTITDRSKEYVGSDALSLLKAIKPITETISGDWAEVDHTSLPDGVRRTIKAVEKDKEDEQGRDLGAYMSLISKAVQELSARMDTLKIQ